LKKNKEYLNKVRSFKKNFIIIEFKSSSGDSLASHLEIDTISTNSQMDPSSSSSTLVNMEAGSSTTAAATFETIVATKKCQMENGTVNNVLTN